MKDHKLFEYLQKNDINFKEYEHPAVFTVDQSKNMEQIKMIPGLRTKNLFLKSVNGFYLVTLPGEKRLDIKSLKNFLKVKDLQFASSKELKDELNLTPGSVSIFGMIYSKNTVLIIDEEILNTDSAGFHPNVNTSTIVLKHKDLSKFLDSLDSRKIIMKL